MLMLKLLKYDNYRYRTLSNILKAYFLVLVVYKMHLRNHTGKVGKWP
jgi:hypothetical protein